MSHERGALGQPTESHGWGTIAWITDRARHGVDTTAGYVELAAGAHNPLHVHPNCTEIIAVLEGRLEHSVGDRSVQLEAGDVLVVPVGEPHQAHNTGTAMVRMFVVYDSGVREMERIG